jgi:SecD/SecF fusion protein
MKKITKLIILCILTLLITIISFIPTLKNINFGLDLRGGFEILYKVLPLNGNGKVTNEDLNNTYKAIVNRIDTLGVSEPVITFEGDNTLRIQLPGVEDEKEAKEIISTIGLLSFRDTSDNLLMSSDILGKGGASVDTDSQKLRPVVKLDIKDTKTFYEVTTNVSKLSDNRIVIWLDYEDGVDSYNLHKDTCGTEEDTKCLSAAYVEEGLNSSSVIIQGNFTKEKVTRLAELINAGSLPTKLVEDSTPHSVSASFGAKTIEKCGIAGIITLLLITVLLVFKYRLSGLMTSLSLLVYSLLTFVIFNLLGGVLTLPGIAALILGIGVSVDSAIIFIERIKEEYKNKITEAYELGSKESMSAIIDANITTLIIAVILYIFGQSSIKGFATMLIISIVVTAISMLIINRFFIKSLVYNSNLSFKSLFGNKNKEKNINFVKISKYCLITFAIILLTGVVFYFVRGINFGIDFSGGTNITIVGKEEFDIEEIKDYLKDYNIDEYSYYVGTKKEGYIKLNKIIDEEEKEKILSKYNELGLDVSIDEISTMVSENLTKNAIYSLLISFVAIIIYIAIRFSFSFGLSGLLALVHDVILIVVTFIIFNIQFNFIIIAALLTIIGYSINDTIVIFDKIRSSKKKINNKEDLKAVLNESLNKILTRNIMTSITTMFAIISLIIIGVNDIFTFNLAILIGVLGGTISSLIFAPNLWMLLEIRNINKPKKEVKKELDELSIKGINS